MVISLWPHFFWPTLYYVASDNVRRCVFSFSFSSHVVQTFALR